jgi:hypothetical protein
MGNGRLFNFEKMFKRHLPKDGRILDAGCGTVLPMIALHSNGYNCLRLDYAINAMRKACQVIGSLLLIFENLISVVVLNI